MNDREGTPVPAQPSVGVLGTLWLVGRKTGADMTRYPIDAERVTFGRDWDSDVRLYFSDVSKLHCEIVFDLTTGRASLHVHGSNGVRHAPNGEPISLYKPPAIIPLSDKDTFIIRKKVFRFEYGSVETDIDTPVKPIPSGSTPRGYANANASPASPQPAMHQPQPFEPIKRRVSHRMSLVPTGQVFEPLASPMKSQNRRNSAIGLGGHVAKSPKKTAMNQVMQEDPEEAEDHPEDGEADEEDEQEMLVEVVNAEEGDMVYLENRDSPRPKQAIYQNAFMTPQQTRKAPIRNTSAVPRTRKLDFAPSIQVSQQAENEPVNNEVPLPSPQTPHAMPAEKTILPQAITPRSIPLPPVSDTPYHAPVPRTLALSTPRGPVTLHKALLVKSARKAWEVSRTQAGVEGAIQTGSIETRRKSWSPKSGGRKSVPVEPVPAADDHDDDDEDESEGSEEGEAVDDEQQEQQLTEGELQWVYENGQGEGSFESEDSEDLESLEADMSLDLPGQSVMVFTPPRITVEDEEAVMNGDQSFEEEEQEEDLASDADEAAVAEEEEVADQHEGEYEREAEEEEEEEVDQPESANTPVAIRTLNKFFTPQPQRSIANAPRRSLISISGPPVRFERLPGTPIQQGPRVYRVIPTPGTLGKPTRIVRHVQEEPEPAQEEEVEEEEPVAVATPQKREINPALIAEAKRRRESLATPRAMPALPASFKTPVNDEPLRNLLASRSHPALLPDSPDAHDDDADQSPTTAATAVPSTPLAALQKRLSSMRRQSTQRQQADAPTRRATVGFVLPSTPARPRPASSASYTVVGNRRLPPMSEHALEAGQKSDLEAIPSTPELAAQIEDGSVSSLSATPLPFGVSLHDIAPQKEDEVVEEFSEDSTSLEEPVADPSVGRPAQRAPPATPSFTGLKEMMRPVQVPKTPYMGGIREMYRQPAAVPPTPNMTGIKSLFAQRQAPATPAMDGLAEMYPVEEEGVHEDQADGRAETADSEAMIELGEAEEQEEVEDVKERASSQNVEMADDVLRPPTATAMRTARPKAAVGSSRIPAATAAKRKTTSASAAAPRKQAVEAVVAVAPTAAVKKASTSASAPTRGRKVADQEATSEVPVRTLRVAEAKPVESRSAPTRTKVAPASSSTSTTRSTRRTTAEPTETASAPTRSTAAVKRVTRKGAPSEAEVEEEEEVEELKAPTKATGSRAAAQSSSRSTKAAASSSVGQEAVQEEKPKATRGRKPLVQNDEQVKIPTDADGEAKQAKEDAPSKPSRGRKAAAAPSESVVAEKPSAPSRRTKTATAKSAATAASTVSDGDKENEPEEAKKVVAKRGAKKVEPATAAAAAVPIATRATRSRK